MLFGNNAHQHVWGESTTGSGCFCMTCGQFEEKPSKKDPWYLPPMLDVTWPGQTK
jgi:hypothetical protein